MDVLSEVLRIVKLEGALFFNGEFSAPWCLSASQSTAIAQERHSTARSSGSLNLHRRNSVASVKPLWSGPLQRGASPRGSRGPRRRSTSMRKCCGVYSRPSELHAKMAEH